MGITHTFVSEKADVADGSLVRPSNWNDLHNVDLSSGIDGILPIINGGSGNETANAALNAFLPDQTGNAGKHLESDGTNTSWNSINTIVSQQFTSQTSIVVTHNYGEMVLIQVFDTDRKQIISFDVQHAVDLNSFTVTFTSVQSGTIVYGGSINATNVDRLGSAFFINNASETVITAIDTPVIINGTTTAGLLEAFTHSSPTLTYTGVPTTIFFVQAVATLQVTADLELADLEMHIFIDGVEQSSSTTAITVGTVFQNPTLNLISSDHISITQNQVLDVRIENKTDTTDILISDFKLMVRK